MQENVCHKNQNAGYLWLEKERIVKKRGTKRPSCSISLPELLLKWCCFWDNSLNCIFMLFYSCFVFISVHVLYTVKGLKWYICACICASCTYNYNQKMKIKINVCKTVKQILLGFLKAKKKKKKD